MDWTLHLSLVPDMRLNVMLTIGERSSASNMFLIQELISLKVEISVYKQLWNEYSPCFHHLRLDPQTSNVNRYSSTGPSNSGWCSLLA